MAAFPPVVYDATSASHEPLASPDTLSVPTGAIPWMSLAEFSNFAAGAPTGSTPTNPPFYVNASATPHALYWHDGSAWNLLGDGAAGGVAADSVTNTELANMAANTIKGAVTAGDPVDLTPANVRSIIASDAGGTVDFLRADGNFAAPPSGGGGASDSGTTIAIGSFTIVRCSSAEGALDVTLSSVRLYNPFGYCTPGYIVEFLGGSGSEGSLVPGTFRTRSTPVGTGQLCVRAS